MNSLKECLPELERVPCLDIDVKLTQIDVDSIKNNLKKVAKILQKESPQLTPVVYDSQISRWFSRDCRDIRFLLRQIETELKHPRDQQMLDFSYAALWLYGEQILLLRSLNAVSRRNHPQARGIEKRSEDLREGLASTG